MTLPKRDSAASAYELRVLEMVAAGTPAELVAQKLHTSTHAVHQALSRLYARWGAVNAPHAVSMAYERGVFRPGADQRVAR
jgi:DNA-binding CsgD family transcriptional regulator